MVLAMRVVADFRRNQWHRTCLAAAKPPVEIGHNALVVPRHSGLAGDTIGNESAGRVRNAWFAPKDGKSCDAVVTPFAVFLRKLGKQRALQ
jgi:hypothetical protein